MKKLKSEVIHKFILENDDKMTNKKMAYDLGVSARHISRERILLGLARKYPKNTGSKSIANGVVYHAMNGMVSLMLLRRAW